MSRSYHFPFVIHSDCVGVFAFPSEKSKAFLVRACGIREESHLPISHFLEQHARNNPTNDPKKDYYISQGYGPEPKESKINKPRRDESRGFYAGGYVGESLNIYGNISSEKIEQGAAKNEVFKIAFIGDCLTIADEVSYCENLQDEVKRLTIELAAANETIAKVREALRTKDGEDVRAHAKVLRQMADALVKLWLNE